MLFTHTCKDVKYSRAAPDVCIANGAYTSNVAPLHFRRRVLYSKGSWMFIRYLGLLHFKSQLGSVKYCPRNNLRYLHGMRVFGPPAPGPLSFKNFLVHFVFCPSQYSCVVKGTFIVGRFGVGCIRDREVHIAICARVVNGFERVGARDFMQENNLRKNGYNVPAR